MQERALKTRIFCDPRQGKNLKKKRKKKGSKITLRPNLKRKIILVMITVLLKIPRHQLSCLIPSTSYSGKVPKQVAGFEFLRKAVASFVP